MKINETASRSSREPSAQRLWRSIGERMRRNGVGAREAGREPSSSTQKTFQTHGLNSWRAVVADFRGGSEGRGGGDRGGGERGGRWSRQGRTRGRGGTRRAAVVAEVAAAIRKRSGSRSKAWKSVHVLPCPIKESEIIDQFLGGRLKDEVLKIMPVQKQTRAGQRTRFKAIVAIGDFDKHVGLGIGKPHTVPCKLTGKCGSVVVRLIPAALEARHCWPLRCLRSWPEHGRHLMMLHLPRRTDRHSFCL
uniref:40S ribosomal protein S2 n=1 Tax=Macrostomum lignano TaxID=282301 RepID=A0A1I8FAM3_9PLAT